MVGCRVGTVFTVGVLDTGGADSAAVGCVVGTLATALRLYVKMPSPVSATATR